MTKRWNWRQKIGNYICLIVGGEIATVTSDLRWFLHTTVWVVFVGGFVSLSSLSVCCSVRDISGLLLHNSFHPGGKNTRLGAQLCLVFTIHMYFGLIFRSFSVMWVVSNTVTCWTLFITVIAIKNMLTLLHGKIGLTWDTRGSFGTFRKRWCYKLKVNGKIRIKINLPGGPGPCQVTTVISNLNI